MADEWLTTTQVGERLGGRSRWWVISLIEAGTFPSANRKPGGHWRVLASEVDAWRESVRPRKR